MGPQSRLAHYIAEQRDRLFRLGEHDCFTFTNGAWRVMHGAGYADNMMGRYATLGPDGFRQLLRCEYQSDTLIEAFDKHLAPVAGVPPRGALVVRQNGRWLTKHALGIACGVTAAFVGEKGVVRLPIDVIDGAWV